MSNTLATESYVVGFIFSNDFSRVLLIRKNKPEWQKGYLNGLGGKIESGERSIDAICREVEEESGLILPMMAWKHTVTIHTPASDIYFFYARHDALEEAISRTSEQIVVVDVTKMYALSSELDGPLVPAMYFPLPNLNWLLPLCIYHDSDLGGSHISEVIHIYESANTKS